MAAAAREAGDWPAVADAATLSGGARPEHHVNDVRHDDAGLQNRASAIIFGAGILPGRGAALKIRGRRSGRVVPIPVAIADLEGERYLASMLRKNVNWVRNLAATDGRAVLRHGRRENVRLEEVEAGLRAPILRIYLQVAPGARPHIPVDRRAAPAEFERIAPDFPVYRIRSDAGSR